MSYSRAAIDAPAQIVSVRAVCGEPSLDQATDDFAEWIGALIQTRLIAMPTSAPDMHTTCDPLGDATAPTAGECVSNDLSEVPDTVRQHREREDVPCLTATPYGAAAP